MNATQKTLTRIRKRLSDPQAWTQGAYARDSEGHKVKANDPAACSWCLEGALLTDPGTDDDAFDVLFDRVWDTRRGIVEFNDAPTTTHEDVLNLLDEAIEVTA